MDSAGLCELYSNDGFWGQPANSVTSLAFVVSGMAILAGRRRAGEGRIPYAVLVIGVGAGSLIQHGPNPAWQVYAHDLPLAGVLAFVAVDTAADLTGRKLSAAWWLTPTVLMVPVVAAGPTASTAVQGALATVAIGLNLYRAWVRPRLRRTLLTSLVLLGVGALVGTLGDRTSLCRPESLIQGHAVWHVLAALSLWRLAPAIGIRTGQPLGVRSQAG
jgi:hypothetical protein